MFQSFIQPVCLSKAAPSFYVSRIALCLAALLVCSIGSAQSWPQRWDTESTYDDEAVACAVDHSGNVFTVGWSKEYRSTYKDLVVIKYNAAGSRQWVAHYSSHDAFNAAYSGDTVGTGIVVDWQGNCYASGVAYSGSTRHNDFVVLKLDPNGDIVWPTSGSAGTGADFDNGAIRLNDNNDDGRDHDNQIRCAIAIRDVPGSQPTFAITGPTDDNYPTAITLWRTVVFEDDGDDAVQIKSGWPLDEFGGSNADTPYAVALHTDDSVYVTGGVHSSENIEQYTTVRYKPDGTDEIEPHYWLDDFGGASENKPGRGRDIKLDYDGNAYVTGTLNYDLATEAIQRDPDEGDPVILWTDLYGEGYFGEGMSLSLSFEVIEELCLFLEPHVYVTGLIQPTDISDATNLVVIRHNYDGTRDWEDVRDDGNERGLHVEAAGDGNAYVVGKIRESTDDDFLLIVYDKTGATRASTPVGYDPDGGFDESRWCTHTGAGKVIWTGASNDSETNLDFLTLDNAEAQDTETPESYSVVFGGSTSGSASNLTASDNSYLSAYAANFGEPNFLIMTFTGTVETENPTEVSITFEAHVTEPGIVGAVFAYDYTTASFVKISECAATTTDSKTIIALKDDARRFVDLYSGEAVIKVVYSAEYGDPFQAFFDFVRWETIGE